MATIVQKYGGSSLADLDRLQQVADGVVAAKASGHDVVVVVSAMGKTTENLLELARKAAWLEPERRGPGYTGEPARRELDMLVSTGERVSMALLSIAVRARGYEAISFTGSQSGILTSAHHFDARILEVRPHRIEHELSRGRIVIVAGYQGMSLEREVTTLGRGGSDTTAVALTAALGAAHCEIYSDVDGVYSADPRSVPGARHLPELDYDTMQEMAEAGAKVLNAQAVEWAKRNSVNVLARRTGGDYTTPNAGLQTRIGANGSRSAEMRAVVAQQQLALLSSPAPDALARALAELELPIRDLTIRDGHTVASVPLLNVPDWHRLKSELTTRIPDVQSTDTGLGSVSLVGVGVGTNARLVGTAWAAACDHALWFSTTPLRISCITRAERVPEIERAWHDQFVTNTSRA